MIMYLLYLLCVAAHCTTGLLGSFFTALSDMNLGLSNKLRDGAKRVTDEVFDHLKL